MRKFKFIEPANEIFPMFKGQEIMINNEYGIIRSDVQGYGVINYLGTGHDGLPSSGCYVGIKFIHPYIE